MDFQRTTAINKLLRLVKRIRIVQGGTWAGKTFGIVAQHIDFAIKNQNREITVVGETLPAIKKGPMKDFKSIMMETGRWREKSWSAADRKYKFGSGSVIEFTSFDTVGKAHSAGKRTDLFINEANYIPFEIADALITRTSGNITVDFNPTSEFWAHTELQPRSDAEFLLLKYSDNEACPASVIKELEGRMEKAQTSEYWKNWCRVYIDGEIGQLQGAVFTNWKVLKEVHEDSRLVGFGLDFGYSNDPTALVALYEHNGRRYYELEIYQTGLLNYKLAKMIQDINPDNALVVADSSASEAIAHLRQLGVNIVACDKGPGSVNYGIGVMQEDEFCVSQKSVDMIRELRLYMWDKDRRTGQTLSTPVDAFNHSIDAARYVTTKFFKPRTRQALKWEED